MRRPSSATGPADAARKEGELTQVLGRLFALAENYPTLKANDNVKMLQEELTSTENKVGFARQFYNDIATKFNTRSRCSRPISLPRALDLSRPSSSRSPTRLSGRCRPSTCRCGSECRGHSMNLYEQQAANRRRTWLVMIGFHRLSAGARLRLRLVLPAGRPASRSRSASTFALGVGSVSAVASYFAGDRAVLLGSGAVPIEQMRTEATDDDAHAGSRAARKCRR